MKLSKKDEEKIYGVDGLYRKAEYITNVVRSCETKGQLANVEQWAIGVLSDYYKFASKNLHPKFFKPLTVYLIDFASGYYFVRKSVQDVILNKYKEI